MNQNLVADNSSSDSSIDHKKRIESLNHTVLNILESTVLSVKENNTDRVQPLWNIMDPLVRLALLNQTQVQTICMFFRILLRHAFSKSKIHFI